MGIRSSITFILLLGATAFGQEAPLVHLTASRPGAPENFGFSVARAGDVDADGVPDFIVGAPGDDDATNLDLGFAEVRSGKDGSLIHLLGKTTANDLFGYSVASAGDVDGDGHADLLVGVPGATVNGVKSGSALVYSGLTGGVLYSAQGNALGDRFGDSVAGGDDLDGDGVPDWVVGAPRTGGSAMTGAVFAYSGADGSLLWSVVGTTAGLSLGFSVAQLGDVNADGHGDVAVGAPGTGPGGGGACLILSGADGSTIHSIVDAGNHAAFGSAVAGGGDYDGDGTPDLILSAAPWPWTGSLPFDQVRVFSGSTAADLGFRTSLPIIAIGQSPAGFAGDVNGDGRDDIIVGYTSGPHGSASIYSGLDDSRLFFHDGTPGEWAFGTTPSMSAGQSVGPAGDVNGDGFDDVLVAVLGGRMVRVLLGGPDHMRTELTNFGSPTQTNIWIGPAGDFNQDGTGDALVRAPVPGIRSGLDGSMLRVFGSDPATTVENVGDLNSDGFGDYAVGYAELNYGMPVVGEVKAYSGADGSLIHSVQGVFAGDGFGQVITALGDVNADGKPDYAVGAYGGTLNQYLAGYVQVISGANGNPYFTIFGNQVGSAFGYTILNLGDLDDDGHTEIAVGAPDESTSASSTGKVYIFSSFYGLLLDTITRLPDARGFGVALADVGDVDHDGVLDFGIGAYSSAGYPQYLSGSIGIYSGSTRSLLYEVHGDHWRSNFGTVLAGVGDVDGDGYPDFAAGAPYQGRADIQPAGYGRVSVYSGFKGDLLTLYHGKTYLTALGDRIAAAGDLNGDGLADFYASSAGASYDDGSQIPYDYPPRVEILYSTGRALASYDSAQGTTSLNLGWVPDGGSQVATNGTLTCGGGSPGGVALFAVSLARVDVALTFGFPLLLANDPVNLLATGFFGFDALGMMRTEKLSRSNPYIAGSYLHIQAFEITPALESSNALRMLVAP